VNTGSGVLALRAVVATGIALLVAAACLTALFNRPEALIDAVRAVASYAQRAGGETHQHPWYYYLRMLLWVHDAPGPVWSEGAIVLLAILGAMGARARWTRSAEQAFGRFLTLYGLALIAIYSAIPYKTPWCLVQIMLPLVLLAGIGVSELMVRLRRPALRVAAAVLLAIALGDLGRQSYAATFRYAADARNPYAYAHPLRDVERLHGYLEQLSAVHPLGRRMEVHVIAPDPWPLPWYLREFEGVGYWESAAEWRRWIADHTAPNAIASGDADSGASPRPHTSGIARPSVLIVIADQQEAILEAVGPSYAAAYYGLRRAETLVVLVEEALRRAFVERAGRAEGSVP
jgi:predicted membrane-bound mannosyltransferase